jgi:hypothetical protein
MDAPGVGSPPQGKTGDATSCSKSVPAPQDLACQRCSNVTSFWRSTHPDTQTPAWTCVRCAPPWTSAFEWRYPPEPMAKERVLALFARARAAGRLRP